MIIPKSIASRNPNGRHLHNRPIDSQDDPGNSPKFYKIAMDSYFNNKPNPTEENITHFIQCTKIPRTAVDEYLRKKTANKQTV